MERRRLIGGVGFSLIGAWCLSALVVAASTNGTTALMLAAASGKTDAVKVLLDRKADINARESAKGETALAFAAAYGRADVIRVLTARGADVKVTTTVVDLSSFAKEEQ